MMMLETIQRDGPYASPPPIEDGRQLKHGDVIIRQIDTANDGRRVHGVFVLRYSVEDGMWLEDKASEVIVMTLAPEKYKAAWDAYERATKTAIGNIYSSRESITNLIEKRKVSIGARGQ